MANDKRDKFFHQEPIPSVRWLLIIIGIVGAILLVTSVSLLAYTAKDGTNISFDWKNFALLIVGLIIGFLGNLLASICWEKWLYKFYKRQEKNRVDRIKLIAKEEIIEDALSLLESYKKRYCENLKIWVKLENVQHAELIKCKITYSLSKVLPPETKHLAINFIRITCDDDANKIEKIRESLLDSKWDHELDERSMSAESKLKVSESYRVNYMVVNSKWLNVTQKSNSYYPNVIEFKSENFHNDGGLVNIEYELEYFLEKESMLFLSIPLPTFDLFCSLDYSALKNLISVNSYSFITALKKEEPLYNHDQTIRVFAVPKSWVFPESNFVFSWYEIENNSITNAV